MRLLYQENTASSFKVKLFVSAGVVFVGVAFSSSITTPAPFNSHLIHKNNTLQRKPTTPITETDVVNSLVSSISSAASAVSSAVSKATEIVSTVTGTTPTPSGSLWNPWYWGGGFGILGLLSLLFFFV